MPQDKQNRQPGSFYGTPYSRPLSRGADAAKLEAELRQAEGIGDLFSTLIVTPLSITAAFKEELTSDQLDVFNRVVDEHKPAIPAYAFRGEFDRVKVMNEIHEAMGKKSILSVVIDDGILVVRTFEELDQDQYAKLKNVVAHHDPKPPQVAAQEKNPDVEWLRIVGRDPLELDGRGLAVLLKRLSDSVGLLTPSGKIKGN